MKETISIDLPLATWEAVACVLDDHLGEYGNDVPKLREALGAIDKKLSDGKDGERFATDH